jgi:hypothetical protein
MEKTRLETDIIRERLKLQAGPLSENAFQKKAFHACYSISS